MEFVDLVPVFSEYGIGGVISLVIIWSIYSFLKSEIVSKFFSELTEKFLDFFMSKKVKDIQTAPKGITDSDILNHDIFNYIDFWTYSKVPTFVFSTDYRTVVFRKYLTIYLKNHKENLQNYINSRDFEKMDSSEIWKSFLSLVNDIIYDYEREMESAGIPRIVIEKMKSKNNDTISLTIDLIEGICNSQFYDSEKNHLKVYSMLNIMMSILENTISNADTICNSINGQLKGLKFSESGRTYQEP